jgi:hypothetical protein
MSSDGDEAGKALLALLQAQNLPDEVMSQVAALLDKLSPAPAADGFPPAKGKPVTPDPNDPKAATIGKPAMDAAIRISADATMQRMQAVRQAEDDVEPIIGRVRGQTTAEAVYRLALDHMKVDLEGLPAVAFGPLFQRLAANLDNEPAPVGLLAQDSKGDEAYAKRFNPDRIRR